MLDFCSISNMTLRASGVIALMFFAHPAHAVLDTPAWDVFHAEADLAQTGQGLKPATCPTLPEGEEALTLMQAIHIALCHNQSTRASWYQLRAQAIGLNQSKVSEYIPSVSASATLDHTSTRDTDSRTDTVDSSSLGVSLGYTLFDFGVREASIDAAEKSMQAAMLNYDSSLQGMIASTIQSYYALLATAYSLNVANENLKYAEASLNAASARYELGLVALSDVLQAQSNYSQSKLSVEQAQNSQQLANNALLVLMGFSPDIMLTITDVDDSVLADNALDVQVQDLIAQANLNRRDLAAAKKSLDSTRSSLEATRRGNLPKVSVAASQNYDDIDILNRTTGRTGTLGFSVSIPIFSGFTRSYTIKSAEENIKAQEILLEQTKIGIAQDVWTAYTNYQTAEQSWVTSFDALNSATEFRDIALGRYKAGVGSLLDVLSAQSTYTSAYNSHITTRFSLLTSRIDLVRAVGILNLKNADPRHTLAELE